MKLIGIGHKARQGKNTLAKEMVKKFGAMGIYAKDFSFSEALKMYCRMMYGMDEKDPQLLQAVGTNLFRNLVNPDIWIDQLDLRLKDENPEIAIITDVRFRNEAHYVSDMKGYLIRLERYNEDESRYIAVDRDPNHQTEIELDDFTEWQKTFTCKNLRDIDLAARLICEFHSFDRG